MKTLRRFLCVVLALAMSLGICSSFAYAKATVTDVKILTPPSKTTFYKGSDWDYGIWQASGEEEEIYWQWESGKKISFIKICTFIIPNLITSSNKGIIIIISL